MWLLGGKGGSLRGESAYKATDQEFKWEAEAACFEGL